MLIPFNIFINVLDDGKKRILSKFVGYANPDGMVDIPAAHPPSLFITRGILTGWRNEPTDISWSSTRRRPKYYTGERTIKYTNNVSSRIKIIVWQKMICYPSNLSMLKTGVTISSTTSCLFDLNKIFRTIIKAQLLLWDNFLTSHIPSTNGKIVTCDFSETLFTF